MKKAKKAKAPKKLLKCPVSALVGDELDDEHFFLPNEGVEIRWDVMGDNRKFVTVCPTCAEHAQRHEYESLTDEQKAVYDAALDCGAEHDDAMDVAVQ